MALTGLAPHPNKAETTRQLRAYVLAHCDADIATTFGPHGFLLEPLLVQLLRDMKALQGAEVYADYLRRLTGTVRLLYHQQETMSHLQQEQLRLQQTDQRAGTERPERQHTRP